MNTPQYEPGQKVWINWTGRNDVVETTVEHVARKWVKLANGRRFERTTGWIDGGDYSSPGTVYVSPETFTQEVETKRLWADLVRRLSVGQPPAGMTPNLVRSLGAQMGIVLR